MKLCVRLLFCLTLLAGCVEQTGMQQQPAPPVPAQPQQVLALDLCPAGFECREGGKAVARVTADSDDPHPHVQIVIQNAAEWGEVQGPPIRLENRRRENNRIRLPNRSRDGLNDRQRLELEFGIANNCYTYWTNGRPACL